MPGQYKFPEEEVTLKRLDRLIAAGEEFYKVRSHPGRTREVEDWRDEIVGMTSAIWGKESHYYGKFRGTLLFPRWFDPKVHGPLQEGEHGRVISPAQQNDTKTALNLYKDGIRKIVAQLKSMRQDVDDIGMPKVSTKSEVQAVIHNTNENHSTPTFSPVINNSPVFSQTQSQSQEVKVWVQELERTIEQKLRTSLEPHEKTFLEKIKGGLSSVKSLAEAMSLAVKTGTELGLSAAAVASLLGI
ncbi:MAG: hypothetical protein BWY29_00514 [Microgenomates group bacterium ADurb.Bin238]|nr:MAG: hypothetical protein BWY29_00514 [Microgenomates group bacterium ADurb.Bin238]